MYEEQEIAVYKEEVNQQVEFVEKIDRLHKNQDFIDVILNGFLKDHALNIVSELASPSTSKEIQEDMIRDLIGQSVLKQYFGINRAKAQQGKNALLRYEQELLEGE